MTDLFTTPVLIALAIGIGAAAATVLGGAMVLRADRSRPRLLAFGLAFSGGAIHNSPESISIAIPGYDATGSKAKAFAASAW
jgi:zinc transporter ZupT